MSPIKLVLSPSPPLSPHPQHGGREKGKGENASFAADKTELKYVFIELATPNQMLKYTFNLR